MIVLSYTDETLDRAIKFLSSITYNYHSREATANYQLLHLSQLMTCILLGPLDLNEHLIDEQKQMEEKINQIADELEQSPTSNMYDMQSQMKPSSMNHDTGFQNIKEEQMYYKDVRQMEPSTSYSTLDDFQAVMQLMRNEGFDKIETGPTPCKRQKIKQEVTCESNDYEMGANIEVQVNLISILSFVTVISITTL